MSEKERIDELERRIKELEARPIAYPPVYIPCPVPQPYYIPAPIPYYPQPYNPYMITYCGGGVAVGGGNYQTGYING